jgi:hypothetical protein
MTVDIWIRDYNPPRCFQKKISGRSKHNDWMIISFANMEQPQTSVQDILTMNIQTKPELLHVRPTEINTLK